ncbi:MAG TPA: endonuclease/exonuclease/phosphatase family protein [Leeuwenhoekiella sp.]|nr:endonuclease/exonuclease/phosphatase family protein [Leeuwenhoekiella sp.]
MKNLLFVLMIFCMTAATKAQEISTMTYNIRLNTDSDGENAWPLRKEYLAAQIKFYDPDFFGVQEALPEQMDFLREQFSAYTALGEGREGKNKGEFSALFYKTKKFNLEENGMFWLSKTPGNVSTGWDAALPRVCTYGLFRLKEGGEKTWVFNTHFDHVGQEARVNSAQLILDKIKELNTENYPVVVMGDLNVEPDNEVITTFKKQMDDTHEVSQQPAFGPKGTFNGFHHNEPVTRRIDHIFVSKNGLEVLKYGILSDSKDLKYPSDHLPVYTLLKFE